MSIVRMHYCERQRLTAADLRFEQDYRLRMAGRHPLAHHDWGIVRGLRLLDRGGGAFLLTPGVAIDGHGREILVSAPVAIEIDGFDPTGRRCLYLDHCEEPQQLRPDRGCDDVPAPRIRQRTAWRLVDAELALPQPAPVLADARAAGRPVGMPPWPVLVAAIGTAGVAGAALVDYAPTRYVAHRAAMLRSPTGRALVQLGLSGRTDVYHFLLSTRGGAATLLRRIGIDRDHAVHVWRPLVISGTEAVGQIAIGATLAMRIEMPAPAGIGRRVRIAGRVDAELRTLSASLVELGAQARPFVSTTGPVELKKTSASLSLPDGRSVVFGLVDLAKRQRIGFAVARQRLLRAHRAAPAPEGEAAAATEAMDFSATLATTGGKLALRQVTQPPVAEEAGCADVARSRGALGQPATGVLQFKPAAAIEAAPLTREIHAVVASAPTDLMLCTALRLSGGAADDSDSASRFSVGARIAGDYLPRLRMDGGRRVDIPARQMASDDPLLDVTGAVYLPPIGKSDPLLPDLLALAHIGGLRRMGRVVTSNPTLRLLPDTGQAAAAVRGTELFYKLEVVSTSVPTIKRTFELITGAGGTGDMSFRALTVAVTVIGTTTLRFRLPRFTRAESAVAIQVLMLVETGSGSRVAVSTSLPVAVTG